MFSLVELIHSFKLINVMHIYEYTHTHVQAVKAVFHVLETQTADCTPRLGRTSLAGFNHPQYNNEICSHICVTGTAYESTMSPTCAVLYVLRWTTQSSGYKAQSINYSD